MRNLSYENEYDLHSNGLVSKTHFHMKGFALGLVLKQRQKRTRKWPIVISYFAQPRSQGLSSSRPPGVETLGTRLYFALNNYHKYIVQFWRSVTENIISLFDHSFCKYNLTGKVFEILIVVTIRTVMWVLAEGVVTL